MHGRIAIAGAHGKIASRLATRLIARGDTVIGLIRNPDHAGDVQATGAEPVVCDLEKSSVEEVAKATRRAEAVVFAAGAGPGSGAERKLTMDRDGAIKLLEATAERAVPYVIVSSIGAENPPPPGDDDVFSVYLRAKAEADAAVQASDRDWTIVRPGGLTDEPGSGRVRIDTEPFHGRIPRDDVADVLAAVLHDQRANHRILYVNAGEESLDHALARALSST